MIKHGMVLAAGLGKRMQPLTFKKPKFLSLLKYRFTIEGIKIVEPSVVASSSPNQPIFFQLIEKILLLQLLFQLMLKNSFLLYP